MPISSIALFFFFFFTIVWFFRSLVIQFGLTALSQGWKCNWKKNAERDMVQAKRGEQQTARCRLQCSMFSPKRSRFMPLLLGLFLHLKHVRHVSSPLELNLQSFKLMVISLWNKATTLWVSWYHFNLTETKSDEIIIHRSLVSPAPPSLWCGSQSLVRLWEAHMKRSGTSLAQREGLMCWIIQ